MPMVIGTTKDENAAPDASSAEGWLEAKEFNLLLSMTTPAAQGVFSYHDRGTGPLIWYDSWTGSP